MELSKIQIAKLDGSNWIQWRYRMSALLRGIDGLQDIVEGKNKRPEKPASGAGDAAAADLVVYGENLKKYNRLDSTALLLITNNIADDTLDKVIRFSTSKDVWDELHRLYEGVCEDRLYDLCLQFFRYRMDQVDDMATHISKLKNIWYRLRQELLKEEEHKELPDILLICKILDTLPEKYFSFKSSWLLMSKKDRTIENITSQLCAHEKALGNNGKDGESVCDALAVKTGKKFTRKNDDVNLEAGKKFRCYNCKEVGHLKKDCPKRNTSRQTVEGNKGVNMVLLSVNTAESDTDRDIWYVDNGATNHVTMRADLYQDFSYFDVDHTVTTADGNVIRAIGQGSVDIEATVNKKVVKSTLRDVWYVPRISKNLFSVLSTQDKNPGSVFESRVTTCSMKIEGQIRVTGNRERYGGLYRLNCRIVPPSKVTVNLVQKVDMLQLYHERMGHQNKRHVRSLIERELGIKTKETGELCEGCIFGKSHRLKFGVREKASQPGERIHTDVCGPFPLSTSKYRYFVLFKDEFTRYRFVYFLREKSEVHEKLKEMLASAKVAGHTVKELLSDNGGEFDNQKVRKVLTDMGINQRLVMPYTPEQNGCSERENRTIVESARAMMHAHEELPQALWAELVNTAVYILNRTGPTTVEHKSPFELWVGKKPQIKHLRIIGSTCYAHVPKQSRKKLHKKAVKCMLIGYDNDDGYRLWNKQNNSLVRSRDVNIDEKPLGAENPVKISTMAEIEIPLDLQQMHENNNDALNPVSQPQVAQNAENSGYSGTNNNNVIHDNIDEGVGTGIRDTEFIDREDETTDIVGREDVPAEDFDAFDDARSDVFEQSFELGGDIRVDDTEDHTGDEIPEQEIMEHGGRILRDRSLLRPPEKLKDYVLNMASCGYQEPSCYREAIKSSERDLWEQAMDCEMDSLKENKTWVLVPLPKNRKAIPSKWVYKVKLNADGSVDKYKARLVIKGFSQKKGIDYDQTFSPVAKMATVRSVLAVAANENMSMLQFDVSTAFLYGSLEEEIFMKQPEGYEDGSGQVCLLKKSLYGLKQAPRCWNKRILDYFKKIGFKVSDSDPCLFIRKTMCGGKLIVALYVDDGLVAATSQNLINEFIGQINSKFKITTKTASYFLGIEIDKTDDGIKISQGSYAKKVLKRFGMENCRPVMTPIVKEDQCQGQDQSCDVSSLLKNYRQVVGALAYLMVGTRPDIAYAVSVVSRSLENPKEQDCIKLKRILRYLQYAPEIGILYKRGFKTGILESYTDADHGGDLNTGRSTTGVLCMYAGGAVSWISQRQTSVAISTTEAEVVAASEGARESIWLHRLLGDMTKVTGVPILRVDNEAAIKLAENPEYHKRTKHIRIRHFFVREMVTNGELNVSKVSTENQLADPFTKALARPRLQKLLKLIGLH